MSEKPSEAEVEKEARSPSTERLIYVVPEQPLPPPATEIDIADLLRALLDNKLSIIAAAAACATVGLAYALWATPWYTSSVLLAPVEDQGSPLLAGQLGGLASLAGVAIGESAATAEAIATLKSRELATEFIEENQLLDELVPGRSLIGALGWGTSQEPDSRDAIENFHRRVLQIDQDRQTSMVTLSVSWTDPALASQWANDLAKRVNERMRQRALKDAEVNVSYLQGELAKTNIVALQQSVGRLLENEMQKLMLARGTEEFAFRVIDSAQEPRKPSRPNRPLIIVLAGLLGGFAATVWTLLRSRPRSPA